MIVKMCLCDPYSLHYIILYTYSYTLIYLHAVKIYYCHNIVLVISTVVSVYPSIFTY